MYHIWNYIFKYDYVIIDEDIEPLKFDIKTIDNLHKNKVDFSFQTFESHIPTNETLPLFLKSKLGLKSYKL